MQKKAKTDSGFLLIEVLIAMVIMAFVGFAFINSITSSSLLSFKGSNKSAAISRLSSAADILSAAPYMPCSQNIQNPYTQYENLISPVKIVAIYGVTKNGDWSHCYKDPDGLGLGLEVASTPWPEDQNASRIQKIVFVEPSGLTRSVVKTFDSKLGNYGLAGSFRTVIRSAEDNSIVNNIYLEVGTTKKFKLDVQNPKSLTNRILYFITQGSADYYSSPSIQAQISGNILTITVPKFDSKGLRNVQGRANLDIEAFDSTASLQAYPAGLGITIVVPPLRAQILEPLRVLINGITIQDYQPILATGIDDPFTYSLGSTPALPSGVTYSTTTGIFSGTPTQVFPLSLYSMTVTDALSATSTSNFQLQVVDQLSSVSNNIDRTFYKGISISSFTPLSLSGGLAPYSYSITPTLPSGLLLNNLTGTITGTPTVTSSQTLYTITGSDNLIPGYVGQSKSISFYLRVITPLTTNIDIPAKVLVTDQFDSFAPVSVSGGQGPYTYSISPSLPAGLSLDNLTGAISGTATNVLSPTTYSITIKDSLGNSATGSFTLRVVGKLTLGNLTTTKILYQGVAITPFSPNTNPVTGGISPYVYGISPTLPAGLTLNTSTGVISGTPSGTAQSTTYTFTVTDSSVAGYLPQSDSGTFVMKILTPLTLKVDIPTKIIIKSQQTNFVPISATGGLSPYTYSISPALPTGLSIDSSTGEVSGAAVSILSPTTYTVTVKDSLSNTSSTTFTLRVVDPLILGGMTATKTFYQGQAITAFSPNTSAVTGGITPYVYSISPTLPAGLSLNTGTGVISGTPTVTSSTITYTFRVTDSAATGYTNQIVSGTFDLRVLVPLAATATQSSRVVITGSNISFSSITATGGLVPYSFSISPALPNNLNFDLATGVISGSISSVLSPTTYSVTVKDSISNTSTASFTLRAVAPVAMGTMTSTKTFYKGVAITAFSPNSTPVTGGITPYVYSISPALPSGLTLNTSTGVISGTPTVSTGTISYTFTATDSAATGYSQQSAFGVFEMRVLSALAAVSAQATRVINLNAAANFIPVTASGGLAPYSYSISPALPTGLTFDSASGSVTGTPSNVTPTTNYTVTVSDSFSNTATATFSLMIPNLLSISSITSDVYFYVGVSKSLTPFTTAGGATPYTYSISPALPAGLSFNSTTGVISGSATTKQNSTLYTETVCDLSLSGYSTQCKSASFNIIVLNKLSVTLTQTSYSLSIGTSYNLSLVSSVSGGLPPYTYKITAGSLPSGMTFNQTTGVLSGTPTTKMNSSTYTLTVSDSPTPQNNSTSVTFSIKVA